MAPARGRQRRSARYAAVAQTVVARIKGAKKATHIQDDEESANLLNAAIAPNAPARPPPGLVSQDSYEDRIVVAMDESPPSADQSRPRSSRSTRSALHQNGAPSTQSKKRKRTPVQAIEELQPAQTAQPQLEVPVAIGKLRRPRTAQAPPTSTRPATRSKQAAVAETPSVSAQAQPSSSRTTTRSALAASTVTPPVSAQQTNGHDRQVRPIRKAASNKQPPEQPSVTSTNNPPEQPDITSTHNGSPSSPEEAAESENHDESADAANEEPAESDHSLHPSLATAESLAARLFSNRNRPKAAPCLDLHKQTKKFRNHLENLDPGLTSLDELTDDLLRELVGSIKVLQATSKPAQDLYCEIHHYLIPHLTICLSSMARVFSSPTPHASQLEPLNELLTTVIRLHDHANRLAKDHKFSATLLSETYGFPLKGRIISIIASLKRYEEILVRQIPEARWNEGAPARAAAFASRQTALSTLRATQLATQRTSSAQHHSTFSPAPLRQPQLESEVLRASRLETWRRLHSLRTILERPQGTVFLSPTQLAVLQHIPLDAVSASAAAHAAQHRAFFTSPSRDTSLPWLGVQWTEDEDSTLLGALRRHPDASKIWERVLSETCAASRPNGVFRPGALGRFGVADVIARGVFLAREAMRTDFVYRRARRGWTLVVDPRLDREEGLADMTWAEDEEDEDDEVGVEAVAEVDLSEDDEVGGEAADEVDLSEEMQRRSSNAGVSAVVEISDGEEEDGEEEEEEEDDEEEEQADEPPRSQGLFVSQESRA